MKGAKLECFFLNINTQFSLACMMEGKQFNVAVFTMERPQLSDESLEDFWRVAGINPTKEG